MLLNHSNQRKIQLHEIPYRLRWGPFIQFKYMIKIRREIRKDVKLKLFLFTTTLKEGAPVQIQ